MHSNHMIKEESGSIWGHGSGLGWGEVYHFGEGVHKDHNCIMSGLGFGELGNEIHGYLLPCFGGYR